MEISSYNIICKSIICYCID